MHVARIQVRNLATIDQVHLDFDPGFHVLTGETGAGKSILVDALKLISGGRADTSAIRHGADTMVIEALFTDLPEEIRTELVGAGLDTPEEVLIVRREISRDSVNRIFVNQSPVTLRFLESLLQPWITIHGQSDQQGLMVSSIRRDLLDLYGQLAGEVRTLNQTVQEYTEILASLETARATLTRTFQERDHLSLQLAEIKSAGLSEGEEEALHYQRTLIRDREAILQALGSAVTRLSGEDRNLLSDLGGLMRDLESIRGVFPELDTLSGECEGLMDLLSDLSVLVDRLLSDLEVPDRSLQEVEDRLALLESLKRKYGSTEREIVEFGKELERRLESLETGSAELDRLEARLHSLELTYREQAGALSTARSRAARRFSASILKRLRRLDMKEVVFKIEVEKKAGPPRRGGGDRVDFLVSTNPGEPPLSLERVASGGELSRIQLALMSEVIQQKGKILLFDEIDQGVGGSAAVEVGSMLRELAGANHVLVVTHLAQVAAHAHHHHHVLKTVEDGRTYTRVRLRLSDSDRVEVMAEMLSGSRKSDAARRHAEELFQSCQTP